MIIDPLSLSVTSVRILKTLKNYDNDEKKSSRFINREWMAASTTYLQYEAETTHGIAVDAINFLLKRELIEQEQEKSWRYGNGPKKTYKLTERGRKMVDIIEKEEELLPWIKNGR